MPGVAGALTVRVGGGRRRGTGPSPAGPQGGACGRDVLGRTSGEARAHGKALDGFRPEVIWRLGSRRIAACRVVDGGAGRVLGGAHGSGWRREWFPETGGETDQIGNVVTGG